jgi:hypothetical protein
MPRSALAGEALLSREEETAAEGRMTGRGA